MAVQFSTASSRNSTPANVMTQLHANLIAAGWELVYADADAIGTGTASSPAWSKAPASGATIGRAVYRMPAVAGYATRWCLEFAPFWNGAAGLPWGMSVRSATDATGSGVLTSPSGAMITGPGTLATSNSASAEWYVSTYEHGVLIALHATTGWMACLERRRRLDGTLLDDLTTYMSSPTGSSVTLGGSSVGAWQFGGSSTRTVSNGEYPPQRWAVLSDSQGTAPPNTLNRMDGTTGIPQGPFNVSGGTAGIPRLFLFLPPNDAPLGVDATVYADGQDRAYYPATSTNAINPGSTPLTRVIYART